MVAVGSRIRFHAAFSSMQGTPTDPSTITLKVRPPGGTQTYYTFAGGQLIKDSTGVYRIDLTVTVAGAWTYRWEGSGAIVIATPDQQFVVFGTSFT